MTELEPDSWFSQTPQWVYFCCVPFIGGFGLSAGGVRINNYWWMLGGVALVLGNFASISSSLDDAWLVIYIAQVAIAFSLKQSYLVQTFPKNFPLPRDHQLAQRVLALRPKIDINTCSTWIGKMLTPFMMNMSSDRP